MTVLLERHNRPTPHAEIWATSPAAEPVQHPVRPRLSAQAARDADGRWERPASDEAFAVVQATKLLDRLEVSNDVRHETRKFIVAVSGRDATVPSVTPGENSGDVTLYWRTGPMSLEVEITPLGADYLWARDETGEILCLEQDQHAMVGAAKGIVRRMGIRARHYNPSWRKQVPRR